MNNIYPDGIYVGSKVVGSSNTRIGELCSALNLPMAEDPHVTIIYSEKAPDSDEVSVMNPVARITNIKSWKGHNDKYYVVAGLESSDLNALHLKWKRRGCEHSFPDFQPHITLGKFLTEDEIPNFDKLNQQLANEPIQVFFEPEYAEALDMSESDSTSSTNLPSRTLARTCTEFFTYNRGAVNAQHSADAAEERYPGLVRKLQRFLLDEGFDEAKIVVFKGLKNPTVLPCKNLNGKVPETIEHAVVQVGGLCIDPCRLRLGSDYYGFNNYPLAQALKEKWKHLVDVTHLTKLTPEDIRHRQKELQGKIHHAETDKGDDDGEKEDMMADVISSSASKGFKTICTTAESSDLMTAFKYKLLCSDLWPNKSKVDFEILALSASEYVADFELAIALSTEERTLFKLSDSMSSNMSGDLHFNPISALGKNPKVGTVGMLSVSGKVSYADDVDLDSELSISAANGIQTKYVLLLKITGVN